MEEREQFVGEPIQPLEGSFDLAGAAPGEPALPSLFLWRQRPFQVEAVVEKWRQLGPCRHGSGERYLRKHWFRIRTVDGQEMVLYFERQPRSRSQRKLRWWLYSIRPT